MSNNDLSPARCIDAYGRNEPPIPPQNHFHVSAAEIDAQDTHQIIVTDIVFIVPSHATPTA